MGFFDDILDHAKGAFEGTAAAIAAPVLGVAATAVGEIVGEKNIVKARDALGHAVSGALNPSGPPAPTPPPTVANPDTNAATGAAVQKAAHDEDEQGSHGMAANILAGQGGLLDDKNVARTVLLGS